MQQDFAEQYDGMGVRGVSGVDREAEKRRLQDRMAAPAAGPRVGVRVDYTRPQQQPAPRVRAGRVEGRRSKEDLHGELADRIMGEIQEREAFLEEMRTLNGEEYCNKKVVEEIRVRLGELRRLEELGAE